MTTKQILLFDIGNVVIEADHEITHGLFVGYGVPEEKAVLFFRNKEYIAFARGDLTEREFYEATLKHLNHQLSYEQVREAHDAHLIRVDKGVVDILDKVPRRKLAIATNTNAWQTAREKQLIDITKYSDHVFRSDEMHMLKGDKECFPYIAEKLGVERNNVVLIDDSSRNTEKAQEQGLRAILYTGAEQLSEEMQSRGFI